MLEARNSTGWLTQTVVSHTKRMGSKFLLHTHGEAKIVPFPDYRFSFSNKRYCRILVSIATVKHSKAAPSKQPTNASLTDQIESSGSCYSSINKQWQLLSFSCFSHLHAHSHSVTHTNTHTKQDNDHINQNNNNNSKHKTSREMKKIIAQGNSNSSIIYQ